MIFSPVSEERSVRQGTDGRQTILSNVSFRKINAGSGQPTDADASRCRCQQMRIPTDFWQIPADFLADASRFTGGR
jgi:hypothetical protein